jgi:Zn finger protein HypA/HybF involved in hydrogenase expression
MPDVHEFSIADALATQVLRHAPARGRVHEVEIRVGALRGLEPAAMEMCWDAVTHDTRLAGSVLVIDIRPWSLACPTCGRVWESPVPFADCACGEVAPRPTATDELDLVSMTVEDEDEDEDEGEGPAEAATPDGGAEAGERAS